ncbi:MAG: tRNA (N(6)-L-threonylcarbamoyladenosine(37)-C(2))-methylthiotransferase MtaB [Bacteroidales bacterium]|nr:tRNA (N(6)-L-threonylcarbamoyladenosine(37)-C(2))-methylthiotransferase MtaB [Bacteroidales bacterium]
MSKMKIAFQTLGCKLNYAETSTYERGFVAAGWEVVPWQDRADVYLINTCAVTEHAEKKARNLIRKMHRTAPEAAIVVTGCYAELRREQIEALEGVVRVFGAAEKRQVVPETVACVGVAPSDAGQAAGSQKRVLAARSQPAPLRKCSPEPVPLSPGSSATQVMEAYSSGERTRSFLKVQDGCDNFCAYCTVPFARGRSRNIPICEAVRQAREIAASGIREIVLTGVNTGDFGRTTGESFLDLLKALNAVDGIERYRISSIEPNLLTDEISAWLASGTKFLPHFHIPLQTGSDTLLKKVGRRYDTALFASRIDTIRRHWKEATGLDGTVFFGIDVIVGLPGETDELFEETYRFLAERIRPAYLHIFPYSRRSGTRAAVMPDQVQDRIKTARVERLEALCRELEAEFIATNRGRKERVLWESDKKDGRMAGYTGNYIRIERPYDASRVGTIEEVTI